MNRKEYRVYARLWWLKNKNRVNAERRLKPKKKRPYSDAMRKGNTKYNARRRKTDLNYRLRMNLRNRIKNGLKAGSTVKDLGCSIENFRNYLESKFQPGMSWHNYGRGKDKWSLDHIVPLSKFDLTDRMQFLQACHYTNMQPMWFLENISKGNK